jgi:LDH2 family malate/lactate/ureidoglycolate dehydrogenase
MADNANNAVTISAARAREFARGLFLAAGVAPDAAALVAEGLIEADLQGVNSHGLLQAPNYLRRLLAGTISTSGKLRVLHASAAVTVFDAGLALGHAVAGEVMRRTVTSAEKYGIAASAVKAATHLGVAGRYARTAADVGLIGIVMCNTRVMLPAPGGTKAVAGNNPLAIAVPVAGRPPIVFDMAMSAVAMGKIRLAAQKGEAIPNDWALDADGLPTSDPAAAISGLLLPAAGAKGFGLALMVDFLCALSGGHAGREVASMYDDVSKPAACSWLFVAIDPVHFGFDTAYPDRIAQLAASIVAESGVKSLPGDRKLEAECKAGGVISLPSSLAKELVFFAKELEVDADLSGGGF